MRENTASAGQTCLAAPPPEHILGCSEAMQGLRRRLPKVAAAQRTTLITGPTGSGKELVAGALHGHSARRQAPFVAVNCGGLPANLVESELFGHQRGAFTDATDNRAGLVSTAHGGTLFLDEVNSLSLPAQASLLRYLENGEFRAVGSDRIQRTDCWVIAASNQDLHQAVEQGTFRRDLLYRLEVVRIDVPSLSARGDDIILLAEHFLERAVCSLPFSAAACAALRAHGWPGNIRELKHRVENAAVFAEGLFIEPEDLGLAGPRPLLDSPTPVPGIDLGGANEPTLDRLLWTLIEHGKLTLTQAIDLCEERLILSALRAEENNRTRAATRLGIHVRTIFKKLAT